MAIIVTKNGSWVFFRELGNVGNETFFRREKETISYQIYNL
jgi:hypothetical protein